ncbi:MAG: hypothetical protein GX051_03600 [Clostridiales bacterium]|nr:hypothetical protein [Clostridiales bacterium]
MFYRSNEHKRLYAMTLKDLHKPIYQMTPEFLSALFLLTSDNKLWNRAKHAVKMNELDFSKFNFIGINTDGYTLCKTAQDLFEGTCHIDFYDLGDSEAINNKIFGLIKSALQIKRDGCCALKLNLKGDIDI